ncbi:unnamed protein product [Blepharisma stoltei]|uniref:Uncharacterized protein n=1 Tax=Blepharisma stoltei TaxID=1481888 RepID=A0AAU9ICQ8_9CILI|nr:unnamed protein product [Blepharisma stoltei]
MAEAKTEKSQNSSHKLWKIEKEKSIKNSIFEFYWQLFNINDNQVNSVVSQQILVAIEATIWCLQTISLLWVPDMPIANWNNNNTIWEVIGFSKFDSICSELGMIDECFYLLFIFTYASFISTIILVIFIYYS